MKRLLMLLALITVFLVACPKITETTPTTPTETPIATQKPTETPQVQEMPRFQGKLLAGSTTPYYEFSKADYELALQSKPYVVLYFYANWCPICRAEQPHTFAAFNEIQRTDMVGFRVNFRDSETDDDEVGLARQFGVTYQHTKVVLKNGERVLKSPETWSKEDYLENLGKI